MPEISYFIENGTVYQETIFPTFTNKITIGPVDATETIRIDDNTVADVTYQFDLEAGEYVELSRVERPEPLPPEPETDAQKIARLEADNIDQKSKNAEIIFVLVSNNLM